MFSITILREEGHLNVHLLSILHTTSIMHQYNYCCTASTARTASCLTQIPKSLFSDTLRKLRIVVYSSLSASMDSCLNPFGRIHQFFCRILLNYQFEEKDFKLWNKSLLNVKSPHVTKEYGSDTPRASYWSPREPKGRV